MTEVYVIHTPQLICVTSPLSWAANLALALIEWAEGDVEVVRDMWTQAFEEAERIDYNQSLDFDALADDSK